MFSLKELFKRDSLNNQGEELSKMIRQKMLRSDELCVVDFAGIANVTPTFFQDFIFPLVLEFGGHELDSKLKLNNLKEHHIVAYRAAISKITDYIDKLYSSQTSPFGDISDLTLELLLKARELSRSDPVATQAIFCINNDMIESFATMDIEIIRRIANAGVICFELRLSPEFSTRLYVFFFHIEKAHKFSRRSIYAYQRYSSYIRTVSNSEPLLYFSAAWAISKWSISGQLKLVRCSHCRSVKLINIKLQHNKCCVCKL